MPQEVQYNTRRSVGIFLVDVGSAIGSELSNTLEVFITGLAAADAIPMLLWK